MSLLPATAVSAQAHQHHGTHEQAASINVASLSPAAQREIAVVARAVERYKDFSVAQAEGWRKLGDDEPLMGEHWYPPESVGWEEYLGSDAKLDFSRPSNLMYTQINGEKVLTGVAFIVRLADGETVPEGFTGTADKWHVHDFVRAVNAATQERPLLRWLANWWLEANYFSKGDARGRLAMLHVWATLPNPDGVFADHNRLLPYMKLDLPTRYASGASLDAARGLNLATPGGCDAAAGGKLWIANAKRQQERAIRTSCQTAVRRVEAALREHGEHPAMLNAEAERAWRSFDAVWNATLSPEQRERVAAISEHGSEHGAGDAHDGH
ncbi:hypothetical protein [Porphyrobacter sp. GA68]|uniref:hypothetical protein n=1 Tax=Porphyrobacter sp. GA68 TaxID=2883480 RepID=UPI001D1836F4|nr:hypothetical protein [Porphyrobacter sp. GA68]